MFEIRKKSISYEIYIVRTKIAYLIIISRVVIETSFKLYS